MTNHPPQKQQDKDDAAPEKRGRFTGQVVGNRRLCLEHYALTVRLAHFPASVPGQFVQLDCTDDQAVGEAAGPEERDWRIGNGGSPHDPDLAESRAFLRRPFSIAARRDLADGGTELEVIYRVVGKGTRHLESLQAGCQISLIGPLGHGFIVPEQLTQAVLVGGGVGIPPMFYLAESLCQNNRPAVAFIGAQKQALLPLTMAAVPASREGLPALCVGEFARYGFPSAITTDDGSVGMKGFVTGALEQYLMGYLRTNPQGSAGLVVYCCGPTPMMRATAAVCARHGVVCQVSLEQPMACGMGTCQSCIIRWKPRAGQPPLAVGPNGQTAEWVYKLTCTDGPVFDAREIVWEK